MSEGLSGPMISASARGWLKAGLHNDPQRIRPIRTLQRARADMVAFDGGQ